jgi:hypothetical protein
MDHAVSVLIPVVLIGWGIYRRIKRTIGYQQVRPKRMVFRIVVFAIVGLLILSLAFSHPIQYVGDAVGLLCGVTLGYFGIRQLKIEKREQGWFYRTHGTVEAIVLVLFIGRIAYRLIETMVLHPGAMGGAGANPYAGGYGGSAAAGNPYGDITHDPLTSGVFFVIVSFYIYFYGYLLRRAKRLDDDAGGTTTVA